MKNTNLKHIISFEVIRSLKKPTFWLAAILLPIALVGYIALAGLVGYNTGSVIESNSDSSDLRLGLYDAAAYLDAPTEDNYQIVNQDNEIQKLQSFDSEEQGTDAVKNDNLDVFYSIDPDFTSNLQVRIFTKNDQLSLFSDYQAPIQQLLASSAMSRIDPIDLSVTTGNIAIESINFSASNETVDPLERVGTMVVPIIALVLFYILIVLFGNRLTTAMVEEKENRISEMILTSVKPQDLIIGKIVSLIILGFIQVAVLVVPIIIAAIFGYRNDLIPANLIINWNPWLVISSLLLLLLSYFLFAGLCVTISTLVPTAKDASSFSSVLMILVILPMFFINNFMTDQPSTIAYALSYFPPSAPIALLLRNAFGTLPIWELLLGLAVIAVSSYFVVRLAVFIFKRSAIEFSSKVSLSALLNKPRHSWSKKK